MIKEVTFSTSQKYALVDLTSEVEKVVEESGVEKGVCLVFVPHATAAITIALTDEKLRNIININVGEGICFRFRQEHSE